jgi:signal transduction histidine kinase
VAHELNNPIGFVHSNLGTLVNYLDDFFSIIDAPPEAMAAIKQQKDYEFLRSDTLQLLAESREGLDRVRKIVQDLKDFSRVGSSHWEWADLQAGLESTLNVVWNELKYKCTVTKEYTSLPRIRCLPSQLNQVFMNLLVNAAQAIPEKGEIHITTRAIGETAVEVVIRDTGKGIAPDDLKRIFDPFFTTKPVGQGTGLGLSIAWGIIGKHHGTLKVESTVGVGTTFTMTLPVEQPGGDDSVAA